MECNRLRYKLILLLLLPLSCFGQGAWNIPINVGTGTPSSSGVTLDPVNIGSNCTLSNGNLTATFTATNSTTISTTSHSVIGTGGLKYQYECKVISGLSNQTIGITGFPSSFATWVGSSSNNGYGAYSFNFFLYNNGVPNTTASTGYSTTPHVVGIVLDCNAGTLQYYYDGSLVTYSSGTPVVTGLTGTWYAGLGSLGSSVMDVKFTGFDYPIVGAVSW